MVVNILMLRLLNYLCDNRRNSVELQNEVNPESWTQLKGSLHTIVLEDNVGHKYHNKVKIAWAESFSFVFEEGIKGTAYKVLFNLDNGNGEFLEMFRQKPGSGYGRNEYGIRFKTHNSLYFTGPNTDTLYPFDY